MKLIFITQQVDPGHPALAATVPKLHALARRVDEVVVLADGAVPGALPPNCRVRLFRAGTRAARGLRFGAALARELRPGRTAVVAHMCPIYAVLAAPLARPLRVPVVLWFTHWRASRLLALAERLCTRVVSVEARSFPLPSRKLDAIGHGIDLEELPCRAPSRGDGLALLALGRYSPAKGLETVLRAVAMLPEARLTVHGPALTAEERAHRRRLEALRRELDLEARVELGDALPRARLPELFAGSDALVNNMRAGAPDKVVYEAAASCLPVLASNTVFDALLPAELRFDREAPDDLAGRLRTFAAWSQDERERVGKELRERVRAGHSVESWAEGVLAAVGQARP